MSEACVWLVSKAGLPERRAYGGVCELLDGGIVWRT